VGFVLIRHDVGEAVVDEAAVSVYEERGWERVNTDPPASNPGEVVGAPESTVFTALEQPAGNASADDWRAYAIAHGVSAEEATSMGRDELKALFVTKEN